ncbi:MAG: AAA family ATPase [bacterium]|nr:AAA family ATPase [bacterium]
MRNRLDAITLKGFKTIRDLDNFRPGPLTVLIGPNGAGKSNFISFFRMLSWMLVEQDHLQTHVAVQGGASKLLHDGPATTREIEAQLTIETSSGENQYYFRLVFAAGDILIFVDERYRFSRAGLSGTARWIGTGAGHSAPHLLAHANSDDTARVILNILRRFNVYQFHNTSTTARIRTKWNMNDNRFLKEDGANIAPLLFRLKSDEGQCYQRIVDSLRLILPFFSDFELEPEYSSLLLAWRERGSDQIFDVSQASDGMLRTIALVTLLLQPDETLPDLLILDEPELGLHPYAINIIGGLIRAVSEKVQVIVATQSTAFVDCFELGDIVVVEREGRESLFRRQESGEALEAWLQEYSLSELWQKNVIGGRP